MIQSMKQECVGLLATDAGALATHVAKLSESTKASLRTTRIGDQPSKCVVRKKKSDIHGNGLFATEDIKKGDCITLYPVDVSFYQGTDGAPVGCYSTDISLALLADKDAHVALLVKNRQYAHIVTPSGMPLTMALPGAAKEDDAHLGHYANDPAQVHHVQYDDLDALLIAEKEYEEASHAAANAAHLTAGEGIIVMTVAQKNIAKGDEILVSYGANWWKTFHIHVRQEHTKNTHANLEPRDNLVKI
jgi:hypothetical protein